MTEFKFDKDLIKSIRRVMGFTTDLRVKLDKYSSYDNSQIARGVYEFIEVNANGIFACADMAINYNPVTEAELYSWKTHNIARLTRCVVTGEHD